MLQSLQQLAGTAFMQRLTLWLNHVLSSEEMAMQRLRPHAGRCVRFQLTGWPSLLPPLPELSFLITPAGLVEWTGPAAAAPDLRVSVDASNPALALVKGLGGERPAVDISGDAALATDVNWLIENLRWDLQDDLARVIGPAAAHELGRVGARLASGMREAMAAMMNLAGRGTGPGQEPPRR